MSAHPAPLWRDPLFSPGDRFPLGPPRGIVDNCQEGSSGAATRPFSRTGAIRPWPGELLQRHPLRVQVGVGEVEAFRDAGRGPATSCSHTNLKS